MENKNICLFIPAKNNDDTLHTINFVLETLPQSTEDVKSLSIYRMYYILEGEGILHIDNNEYPLSLGDVFFVFPAAPFSLESKTNFKFSYISFLGIRGNYLLDKFNINKNNCFFPGFPELAEFWKNALYMDSQVYDLRSESVLLYTFACIATKYFPSNEKNKTHDTATIIKKYLDTHFTDPKLSLNTLSAELSYHPKYISSTFKNTFKIGVSEYLNVIRIQNACALMEQGVTAVKNIASLCGFNDPLYFSKIFKAKMGVSPKDHIETLKKS